MISKEKLVFDPANPDDTDNSGAFVRSADGSLVTSTTDGAVERLDVSTGAEHYEGTAFAGGEKGSLALAVDNLGNFAPLRVNAAGELLVDVQVTTGSDKAEDSAHVDGDIGSYILSVREDTLASSTSATGDYQSFKTDSLGALWANVYKTAPATHTGWLVSANNIVDTAELVVAADLANRKTIMVQNVGNRPVYLGHSNAVTSSNGIRLSAGAAIEVELAAGVNIYAISDASGSDIRVAEFAYAA